MSTQLIFIYLQFGGNQNNSSHLTFKGNYDEIYHKNDKYNACRIYYGRSGSILQRKFLLTCLIVANFKLYGRFFVLHMRLVKFQCLSINLTYLRNKFLC